MLKNNFPREKCLIWIQFSGRIYLCEGNVYNIADCINFVQNGGRLVTCI